LGFVLAEKENAFLNWLIASVIACIMAYGANRVIMKMQHGSTANQ
jgi:hypothetical protein